MSAAGITFGSHTRTHPDLTRLPTSVVEEEMAASKRVIEDATGLPVLLFAYPYGAYDARAQALASTHFRMACSTRLGFVRPESDPFALERIDVYYVRAPLFFRRLFSPEIGTYIRMRRKIRDLRSRLAAVTTGAQGANEHPAV
jgi:peptidoglycan/xylan/chitin deacetylase (PgdA/CDA1 family)